MRSWTGRGRTSATSAHIGGRAAMIETGRVSIQISNQPQYRAISIRTMTVGVWAQEPPDTAWCLVELSLLWWGL